jgi:hypothetical protein
MKTIKYVSILFFLIVYGEIYCQDSSFNLPDYTPPSPEAYALTKYSNVSINEFTGMVSKTIPLYNYKAGQLELPISLNYSGAGIKVDDLPSWVGMNWTLSAGGVITRSVRDIADEVAATRINFSDSEITNYNLTTDGTSNAAFLKSISSNSQIDSEVDIFQFNFGGYSGSFYIDNNWNARLIKSDSPLKIDIENRLNFYTYKIIKITTPDGIIYTFGGPTATEDTNRRTIVDGSMQSQDALEGTTAFYLVTIEHPLQGTILFEYTQDLGNEIIVSQKIQKLSRLVDYSESGNCSNFLNHNDKFSSITVSTRILNPKYLLRIYSYDNPENIYFNSARIDNRDIKMELKSIVIDKDNNIDNGIFNKIKFEYLGRIASNSSIGYQDISKRFFLKKIIFDEEKEILNTSHNKKNEVFSFEYDGYERLPYRFDASQDYGGYYNGISNISLIPSDPHFNPNNNTSFANRMPNFEFASKGALSKIIYPTGGYTTFEYEAPKAKKKDYEIVSLSTYRNQSGLVYPNKLQDGIPSLSDGIDNDGDGEIDITPSVFSSSERENQIIDVSVNAAAFLSNSFPTFFPQQERVILRFTNITTIPNQIIEKVITFTTPSGPVNEGYITKTANYSFNLLAGNRYKLELIIQNTSNEEMPGTEVPMTASATFNYFKGFVITDGIGVRIKKHINYTEQGLSENITRYYYDKINKINPPIEELPLLSGAYIKTDKDIINKVCSPVTFGETRFNEIWYLFENIYSDRYNVSNVPNIGNYKNVTISYGGDNFENGGVEKTFTLFDDIGATHIKTIPGLYLRSATQSLYDISQEFIDNLNIPNNLNGILINETYYTKLNTIKKSKQINYSYDFNPIAKINNIISKRNFDALYFESPVSEGNTASNYTFASYFTKSSKSELLSKQVIEYIEPVPLDIVDESIYKKIITTENYTYGVLRGMPKEISISTSESNINKIIKNYYVSDDLMSLNLNPAQMVFINDLKLKNIVQNPIQIVQYQNNDKISTTRTLYKNISLNASFTKIVPAVIQYTKGNNELENRIEYISYNSYNARPILVSLSEGTIIGYEYNNKGQVILKIVNAPVEFDDILISNPQTCYYQNLFTNSQVTNYEYDSSTDNLSKIIDPKCNIQTYHYDSFNRLQFVKDEQGNILSENEYHYKN